MDLVIETADSHPESAHLTGEWLLGADASLQIAPQASQPVSLHVWVPASPVVVLGASQSPENEMDVSAWLADCAALPPPARPRLCKRRGGGGAVLLGSHSLCVALRGPRLKGQGPLDYFQRFNGSLIEALSTATGIDLVPQGISDLASEVRGPGESSRGPGSEPAWRKVVGTSLYLSRDHALYLASVLVQAPGPELERWLKHPSREPGYRQGRSHRDFMTDLQALGFTQSSEALIQPVQAALWSSLLRQAQGLG